MPTKFVPRRVKDIIFYYYAKLVIAPSAGFRDNYAFIMDAYNRLRIGQLRISDYERELELLSGRRCLFCDQPFHTFRKIIPRGEGQFIGRHNLVPVCQSCDESWGDCDVVTWWCNHRKELKELLPRPVIGAFLKLAYEFHHVGFSLDKPCSSLEELAQTLREG